MALVSLSSTPPGTEVREGGFLKGITPLVLPDVPAGNHTYKFSHPGYDSAEITVTVVASQELTLATVLSPSSLAPMPGDTLAGAASPGSLTLASDPPGALVYIDDELAGTTPFIPENLSPGTHSLKASLAGYVDYTGTVEFVSGKEQTVMLKFSQPLPDSAGATGVLFTSSPPGADVKIDGTIRGITPISITDISRGTHSVTMSLPFFGDYDSTFRYTGEPLEITGKFSLSNLEFPEFGFITGLFSGISLPGSGAGEDAGPGPASDKQKAYEELVAQMDSGD
jgi:hypothetical protein